jgi:hypothetical protein
MEAGVALRRFSRGCASTGCQWGTSHTLRPVCVQELPGWPFASPAGEGTEKGQDQAGPSPWPCEGQEGLGGLGRWRRGTRVQEDWTGRMPLQSWLLPLVHTKAQARYAVPWIATEFSQHLRSEYWQETDNAGEWPILRLYHIPETRACCDICAASFHLGSCGCCGREFCKTCYNNWVPSGMLVSGKLSRMDQCSRKRRHGKESILFLYCLSDTGF